MKNNYWKNILMHSFVAGVLITFTGITHGSSFAKIQFGQDINIEVPKNWRYLDSALQKHINTASEAIVKLEGLPVATGENKILFAANAVTASKTNFATLRLSVRNGQGGTQAEVVELSKMTESQQNALLLPALEATTKVLSRMKGVSNVKVIGAKVDSNKYISCILSEFKYRKSSIVTVSKTWLCPFGTKAVKLSASYKQDAEALLSPVIRYVFESLNAK